MAMRKKIKDDHPRQVLLALNEFRAWDSICDFTIKVENETFTTHRAVLASCSSYFKDLLTSGGSEAREGGVELTGISACAARRCIEFMYSGEAMITMESVDHILMAAGFFRLQNLTQLCIEFLEGKLDAKTYSYIKEVSEKYNMTHLGDRVEKFINENLESVIETDKFLTLPKDGVIKYLASPNIGHSVIWAAIAAWVKFRLNTRKTHLLELLSLNLVNWPIDYLLNTVWKDDLVRPSNPCQNLIIGFIFREMDFFKSSITINNCFLLRELCDSHRHSNSTKARNEVRLFMMRNFEKIADMNEICQLSKDDIFEILKNGRTRTATEIAKWEVAVRWTKFDMRKRKKYFPELLALIKLENTSADFIQDVVRAEPLVQDSKQCLDIIIDALYVLSDKPQIPSNVESRKNIKTKPKKVVAFPESSSSESSPEKSQQNSKITKRKLSDSQANFSGNTEPKRINLNPTTKKHQEIAQTRFSDSSQSPIETSLFVAVYNKNLGKINGFTPKQTQWKNLAITKVMVNGYQAIVSVNFQLYLLKNKNLFLLDMKNGWKKLAEKEISPSLTSKIVSYENSIFVIEKNKVSTYDTEYDSWEEINHIKVADESFCVCSTTQFIYILGGEQFPSKARVFDPLQRNLKDINQMTFGRQNATATTLKGDVYVLGGIQNGTKTNSVECYNSTMDTWMNIPNMQVQRSGFASCTLNDQIYVLGGDATGDSFWSVEVYEKHNKKWKIFHRMLKIDGSFSACIVENNK
uniref:kelch-like protein 12 n=1 Tax=Styela clava TaxID=7725 RepID=UPI00193976CB|nr:kelch-like protein 12 [Styela clava]